MVQRRLQKPHHHPDNGPGRVESAALLAGCVSEFGGQVLVGGNKQGREFEIPVAQADFTEMGDQLTQLLVADLALADLAGEVDVIEDTFKDEVLGLDPAEGLVQFVANVFMCLVNKEGEPGLQGNPKGSAAAIPDLVLGILGRLLRRNAVFDALFNNPQPGLLKNVGTAFQKQHPEDVFLEF